MTRILPVFALSLFSTAASAGAVASSFKRETRKGANYWNAQSAIDGKMETCWMVPGESQNRGESLTLDVPKSTLDKIGMVVGWDRDEDTFQDYARVKAMQIEVFNFDENNDLVPGGSAVVNFEDKRGMQVVDFDDIPVGGDLFGGKVKLTVTEVYPGRDFPNLAVSEVLLHLAEFDAAPQIKTINGVDAAADEDVPNMADDNARTFWAGPSDLTMKFEAPGFSLARVGLTAGAAGYDRPKKVRVTANSRDTIVELADSGETQWVNIPAIVGYTGSAWGVIELQILEVYPGDKHPGQVAIGELDLKATAYEGI